MIGDARADRYKAAVRTVLEDDNVDMGIVILTPQSMTDIEETAAVVPEVRQGHQQAGGLLVHGRQGRGAGREDSCAAAGVPNYPFPEDGVKSLAAANWLVALQEIPRREMTGNPLNDLDVDRRRRSWPNC